MSRKKPTTESGQSAAAAAVTRMRPNVEYTTFSDNLLMAMLSFRDGNFSARMPSNIVGVEGKIADAFNDIVMFSDRRSRETVRVSSLVGKEGKLKQRMNVPEGRGGWADE